MAEHGSKNIIIVGGSYGGLSAAHYILKHVIPSLPKDDGYEVILVSASGEAMCRPACPRALISDQMFDQKKLFVDIPEQFKQYGQATFRFIKGTATRLDHEARSLEVRQSDSSSQSLPYHALVIATGSSTRSPLLGLNGTTEDLRNSWSQFRKVLPRARSIVIAGGGPAGIETAGELGEYLNGRAGWFKARLDDPKVAITVVTSGAKILPVVRASLATKAEDYLEKVGVTVIKNAKVSSVESANAGSQDVASACLVTLHDGTTIEADLYIPATGTTPNTSFVAETLLTPDGRVDTNPATLRVDKAGPRVYAVGDCASYARPAVHNILNAIPVLGPNIKRDLLLHVGKADAEVPKERTFKEDTRETQLVPVGKSKGVGAAMGYALPSWLVWLIKGRDYWLWTTGGLWSGKQWNKES